MASAMDWCSTIENIEMFFSVFEFFMCEINIRIKIKIATYLYNNIPMKLNKKKTTIDEKSANSENEYVP